MPPTHAPPAPSPAPADAQPRLDASDRRYGMAAGKVLLAGVLGLGLAIVLNSQQLLREAQQKPFGWERDASVTVWAPVEGAASAVGAHLPRLWADQAFGRDVSDPGAASDPFSAAAVGGSAGAGADTGADTGAGTAVVVAEPSAPGDAEVASAGAAASGSASTSAGQTAPDAERQAAGTAGSGAADGAAPWFPTPADPLRLHVMGDSMVQFFGHVLVGLANDTGVIEASSEHQLSSGLSRPDFYDWPTRIVEVMAADDPDAVVLMFGGNDAQAIVVDGQIARRFSNAWTQEYAARVGHVMDLVTTDPERVLIWVGQPIMEDPTYDSRMQQVNEVFEAEAAKRERVQYVDTRDLFRGPNGGFSRYVADADGQIADVRLSDGVHLSTLGGRWLSEVLLDELGLFVDLSSGASP